jgi:hypothetical protein
MYLSSLLHNNPMRRLSNVMLRVNNSFSTEVLTIEGTWRLCNTNQMTSKTDSDSKISFPNEETSS